jgi:hypothetical protein
MENAGYGLNPMRAQCSKTSSTAARSWVGHNSPDLLMLKNIPYLCHSGASLNKINSQTEIA